MVQTVRILQSGLPKGQLISKANFEVFIWTKNEQNYFFIFALASKVGQIV